MDASVLGVVLTTLSLVLAVLFWMIGPYIRWVDLLFLDQNQQPRTDVYVFGPYAERAYPDNRAIARVPRRWNREMLSVRSLRSGAELDRFRLTVGAEDPIRIIVRT